MAARRSLPRAVAAAALTLAMLISCLAVDASFLFNCEMLKSNTNVDPIVSFGAASSHQVGGLQAD